MRNLFAKFAARTAHAVGSQWAFLAATLSVVVWAATGPLFNHSDTWQLVINTGTTVVTFLIVFLIQNTQNRDAKAIQLKLDELILKLQGANNDMIDIEELSDEQLEAIAERYRKERARRGIDREPHETDSKSGSDESIEIAH